MQKLFTIGYEGISINEYVCKLTQNKIKTLVDVRRNAYSKKPGFNKQDLQYLLSEIGMKYIHIPELGIESDKREEYKRIKQIPDLPLFGITAAQDAKTNLFADYEADLPSKQKYINQLLDILDQDKFVAITCFEADAKCCHRHQLTNYLQGIEVVDL